MRLTPAQCGMYGLLGQFLPFGMPREWSVADRVRHGHEFLVQIAGIDLGYDPRAWDEHLRATDAGGYKWGSKHRRFPRLIAQALTDPEWLAAVASLRGDPAADRSSC